MCSCNNQTEALSGQALGISSTIVTGVAVALATTAATVAVFNKSKRRNQKGIGKYVVPALVGFGVSLVGSAITTPINVLAYEV